MTRPDPRPSDDVLALPALRGPSAGCPLRRDRRRCCVWPNPGRFGIPHRGRARPYHRGGGSLSGPCSRQPPPSWLRASATSWRPGSPGPRWPSPRSPRSSATGAHAHLSGDPADRRPAGAHRLRVLVKAPALIRCEVESDGSVTVIDGTGNRILVLDPKIPIRPAAGRSGGRRRGATNLAATQVEGLRKLAEARSEPVGRSRIGDVEAEGFRVGRPEGSRGLVRPAGEGPASGSTLKTRVNDV